MCDKAAYLVVKIATSPSSCPTDVDRRVAVKTSATATGWVACLDYSWVGSPEMCIEISGDNATKVRCDRPRSDKAERFRYDAATLRGAGACKNGAFEHKSRGYAVCATRV